MDSISEIELTSGGTRAHYARVYQASELWMEGAEEQGMYVAATFANRGMPTVPPHLPSIFCGANAYFLQEYYLVECLSITQESVRVQSNAARLQPKPVLVAVHPQEQAALVAHTKQLEGITNRSGSPNPSSSTLKPLIRVIRFFFIFGGTVRGAFLRKLKAGDRSLRGLYSTAGILRAFPVAGSFVRQNQK